MPKRRRLSHRQCFYGNERTVIQKAFFLLNVLTPVVSPEIPPSFPRPGSRDCKLESRIATGFSGGRERVGTGMFGGRGARNKDERAAVAASEAGKNFTPPASPPPSSLTSTRPNMGPGVFLKLAPRDSLPPSPACRAIIPLPLHHHHHCEQFHVLTEFSFFFFFFIFFTYLPTYLPIKQPTHFPPP